MQDPRFHLIAASGLYREMGDDDRADVLEAIDEGDVKAILRYVSSMLRDELERDAVLRIANEQQAFMGAVWSLELNLSHNVDWHGTCQVTCKYGDNLMIIDANVVNVTYQSEPPRHLRPEI